MLQENDNWDLKDTGTFTCRLLTTIPISGNKRESRSLPGAERMEQSLTGLERLDEETLEVCSG